MEGSDGYNVLGGMEAGLRPANTMKSLSRASLLKVLVIVLFLYFVANVSIAFLDNYGIGPGSGPTPTETGIDTSDVHGGNESGLPLLVVHAASTNSGHTDDAEHGADQDPVTTVEDDTSENALQAGKTQAEAVSIWPSNDDNGTTNEHGYARARQRRCDELVNGINIRNEDTIDAERCNGIKEFCGLPTCLMNMDVVVLWVNGSDPNQVRCDEYCSVPLKVGLSPL